MEQGICKICQKDFVITPDEIVMYDKLEMERPKLCFQCRVQQKLAFWVFGKFRKTKSDLSGESLITALPSNPRYPIYSAKEWWSDSWEAKSLDYDPNRPFFDQIKDLQNFVPRPHQVGENSVLCDWCDEAWNCKNCYLSRAVDGCENVAYGYRSVKCKDAFDITYCFDTENSYYCTYCFNSYNLFYSFNCRNAINSYFLFDCRNVQDCFMCWNLRGQQYCIMNQRYSKEEYKKKIQEYNLGSRKVIAELYTQWRKILTDEAVHRENFNFRAPGCTGNYLSNCDKSKQAFYWENSQECYNCVRGMDSKNIIDTVGGWRMEFCGNMAHTNGGYMTKSALWSYDCRFCEYIDQCKSCENCFGCVGLKQKRFCILNKQYSEEEYKQLVAKIKIQMTNDKVYGDFFPYSLAPFGYNSSTANVYFPKTEEEVLQLGGLWDDLEEVAVEGMKTSELPDDIKDLPAGKAGVQDAITTQPLVCPETGYRFNISPRELAFYREKTIPLPRLYFDTRMIRRFNLINNMQPYPHTCMFCKKEISAYYPPAWGYKKFACEPCYQREFA